jgi:hypothetical protein
MAFWGLDFYDWNHGRQMLIDGNYIYVDNYLQAGASLRAPIFYDSNDTSYYLDPNSSSVLYIVTTNGRIYSNEWIQFSNNTGLYSPTNGAHFRPNTASYGPWLVTGSRGGWNGLEFDGLATGNVALMIRSSEVGTYNTSYGWQFRWTEGYLYCYRSTYGGGTVYQVWDSGSAPRAANNSLMYYQGFTLDANTMDTNSTGFTYAVNAPYVGPVARFSTGGGYDLWFNAPYSGGGESIAFRTRNGDSATLNAWRYILTDANYTNYAVPTSGYTFGTTFSLGTMYASTGVQGANLDYMIGVYTNGYVYRFTSGAVASWIGLGSYLPLSGGTMSGKIITPSSGADVYGGAIEIRERGYVLATQDAWSYSPAITFHWGNRWVKRFGGRADGQLAVDDVPIVLNTGTWSINVTGTSGSISGFNNPTTAATPNTIVYRDGIGDITTRELVLNVGVQDFIPSSMVAIYPTTNQAVKVTASGARGFLNVPTRTGGDASGTWGININGYSQFLTSNSSSVSNGFVSWNSYDDTTNNPGTSWWYGMRVSHGDAISYYSFSISSSFFSNGQVYYRRIQGGTSQNWVKFMDEVNSPYAYNMNQYVRTTDTVAFNQARFNSRISIGDGNGTPYLNTGSPGIWLSYNGASDIFMGAQSSTVWGVYIGDWRFTINSSGQVTASSFFESSDMRIKELIEDNYKADGIESITARLYNKNGKIEVGYYAQDVQGILPSAVSVKEDGYLNLSYREVHTAKIAYLENKIKQLEEKLNSLY